MTDKERELVLKDLSARLPYGVKCCISEKMPDWVTDLLGKMENCKVDFVLTPDDFAYTAQNLSEIKPYLRPMDSMTEEELAEWEFPLDMDYNGYCIPSYPALDWLNEHHFDYRGLIERGLALEAPEGMYD